MNEQERVDYWTTQIGRAKDLRARVAKDYQWDLLEDMLASSVVDISVSGQTPKNFSGQDPMTSFVNWPHAYSQVFIPAVYFRHPKIEVRPEAQQYQGNAHFVGAVTNAALHQCRFRKAATAALYDNLPFGHGWVELGWCTSREGMLPAGPTEDEKELNELLLPADVTYNAAFARRVSPRAMLVDPDVSRYEDLRWIARESWYPADWVKKHRHFKVSAFTEHDLPGFDKETETNSLRQMASYQTDGDKWARVYDIWDRYEQKVHVMVDGAQRMAQTLSPWPYPDIHGFPFKLCSIMKVPDRLFAPSPIVAWLPLVNELGHLRTVIMDHVEKAVTKILIPKGALDAKQEQNLGDPYCDYLLVDDENKAAAIRELKALQPSSDTFVLIKNIVEDIRSISGFEEILSGSVPYSRMSATVGAIMEQNATLRFDRYAEEFGDFILECGEDMFLIVRRYQPIPLQVQIGGALSTVQHVEITDRRVLDGKFRFSLSLDDMSIAAKNKKVKEAVDRMTLLAGLPIIKLHRLVEDLLTSYGISDIESYVYPEQGPPRDPFDENKDIAEGRTIPGPNPMEDHAAHLDAHNAFMMSNDYVLLRMNNPIIHQNMMEHVQQTMSMARQLMQRQQLAASMGGPRPTPSTQGGKASPANQPRLASA